MTNNIPWENNYPEITLPALYYKVGGSAYGDAVFIMTDGSIIDSHLNPLVYQNENTTLYGWGELSGECAQFGRTEGGATECSIRLELLRKFLPKRGF